MLIALVVGTTWLGFATLFGLWSGVSEIAIPAGLTTIIYTTVMSFLIF